MSAQMPDELHHLRGTRPTRAAASGDSQFKGGRPRIPKHFDDLEKECWRDIVRVLAARGILSPGDAPNIALYAEARARQLRLLKELKEKGEMVDSVVLDSNGEPHTKRIINPASKAATTLANTLRGLLKELCATVASRERAKPAAPAKRKKEDFEPGTIGWMKEQQRRGLIGGNSDEQEPLQDDSTVRMGIGDIDEMDAVS